MRIRTVCRGCHGGCGVVVRVEGACAKEASGNGSSPVSKGRLSHKVCHDPSRIMYPFEKTKGGWKKISWEEALDEVSDRLASLRDRFGAESVVVGVGAEKDNGAFAQRLSNPFGTPNLLTAGHICYVPRFSISRVMLGSYPVVDYEGRPSCIIARGSNPVASNPDEYKGFQLVEAIKRETRLIVVNPRRTWLSRVSDMHVPVTPGRDAVLLWGMLYVIVVNPKCVWDVVIHCKLYRVRAMILVGTDPVTARAGANDAFRALESVDFLVVSDMFMTPTALLADIVLPASHWLETDFVAGLWKGHGYVLARVKAVQVGESVPDYMLFSMLGRRLTDANYWWESPKDLLNLILSPSGLTFSEFKRGIYIRGEIRFRKHREKGFRTSTGKVKLYSNVLEKLGYDSLPGCLSPSRRPTAEYPFFFITGSRVPEFFHSEGRSVSSPRERHKYPILEMAPVPSRERGIADGDWVRVFNGTGSCIFKVKVTDSVPDGVVSAEHGWWFPEDGEDSFFGRKKSNVNLLTGDDIDDCDSLVGSTNIRVDVCNVDRLGG